MEINDPGYAYSLEILNQDDGVNTPNIIQFVNKDYSGTTMQEVLRVLISKIKHEDTEFPSVFNNNIILILREAIYHLEYKHSSFQCLMKEFYDEIRTTNWSKAYKGIEDIIPCNKCGYFVCKEC